jgi:hypothetical protein
MSAIEQCIKSLSINKMGTEHVAMTVEVYLSNLCGILAVMSVRLYHESVLKVGIHVMISNFGPNAIHLPTRNAHSEADNTNKIRIYILERT